MLLYLGKYLSGEQPDYGTGFLRKPFPRSSELQRYSGKRKPLGCNLG